MKQKYSITSGIDFMSAAPVDEQIKKQNKQANANKNNEQNLKGEKR
jgi:hypothetical protein